jgi:transposase
MSAGRARQTTVGAGEFRHRRDAERPSRAELEREIERLRRENERLREKIDEQAEQILEKKQEIGEKNKQIADLEQQLAAHKRNSTNSSKPPSSDGLAGAPRKRGRKDKSRRRPGGQPGHPGRHRQLVPQDQVKETHVVLPAQCKHCGRPLPQDAEKVKTQGEPRRHQVTEVPKIEPEVTEYQCPNVLCRCGKTTQAPLPAEVKGHFGPRLTALIAYLTVLCRQPRRVVERLLADVLGIDISLGSTQKAWEQVSQAVEQPCQELQQQLPREAVLNVDDTGWRKNREKRHIWAFVAKMFAFYTIAGSRGAEVLVAMLGIVFGGILCNDRAPAFLKYHSGLMQFCWAHLKRTLLGIADSARSPSARLFCRDVLAILTRLFRLWHRFRGDLRDRRGNPKPIDRSELMAKARPLQKKLFALAEAHVNHANRDVSNFARALFLHFERLFLFLERDDVEPTNNVAERILRIAVQWRKTSFGNRSDDGEVATARLLTVTQTCRMQRRHVLGYLTEAVRCYRSGQRVPSLLAQQITA